MEEEKTPSRLYIEYDEDRTGGEIINPEERWSSHEDTIINITFHKLYRERPSHRFFYDSVEVPDERMLQMSKLYLAVIRYGTGDTFGHTDGAWYIVGIAPTREIAQAMLDEETIPAKQGDYRRYKRWQGYFESLQGTEIHELDVV